MLTIRETTIFTRQITETLTDEEYRLFQEFLIQNPEGGKIIPGLLGLRKIRWSLDGKGKRGGIRVIYYWQFKSEVILMLFAFRKNEQDDLTADQKNSLKELIKKEFK